MNHQLEDNDSNNGFSGEIWGSALWFIMHIISFNYPIKPTNSNIMHYYSFFKNIQNILPCSVCRKHLKETYKKHPLTAKVFKNRKSLTKYIYNLHNIINTQLNKKNIISFDDIINFYENLRSRCIKNKITKETSECNNPVFEGIKSRSIIRIIPRNDKCESLKISNQCILKKIL